MGKICVFVVTTLNIAFKCGDLITTQKEGIITWLGSKKIFYSKISAKFSNGMESNCVSCLPSIHGPRESCYTEVTDSVKTDPLVDFAA